MKRHIKAIPLYIFLWNFLFRFEINNASTRVQKGTVRIFMGPKVDEGGRSMIFDDHRVLFIEMDKFTVQCKFYSLNQISRKSNLMLI